MRRFTFLRPTLTTTATTVSSSTAKRAFSFSTPITDFKKLEDKGIFDFDVSCLVGASFSPSSSSSSSSSGSIGDLLLATGSLCKTKEFSSSSSSGSKDGSFLFSTSSLVLVGEDGDDEVEEQEQEGKETEKKDNSCVKRESIRCVKFVSENILLLGTMNSGKLILVELESPTSSSDQKRVKRKRRSVVFQHPVKNCEITSISYVKKEKGRDDDAAIFFTTSLGELFVGTLSSSASSSSSSSPLSLTKISSVKLSEKQLWSVDAQFEQEQLDDDEKKQATNVNLAVAGEEGSIWSLQAAKNSSSSTHWTINQEDEKFFSKDSISAPDASTCVSFLSRNHNCNNSSSSRFFSSGDHRKIHAWETYYNKNKNSNKNKKLELLSTYDYSQLLPNNQKISSTEIDYSIESKKYDYATYLKEFSLEGKHFCCLVTFQGILRIFAFDEKKNKTNHFELLYAQELKIGSIEGLDVAVVPPTCSSSSSSSPAKEMVKIACCGSATKVALLEFGLSKQQDILQKSKL